MFVWITSQFKEAYSGIPRPVWFLSFVTFVNYLGTMVIPFLAIYLNTEVGIAAKKTGTILGLYGFGSLLGGLLGGWLSERFAPLKTQAIVLFLSGILWALIPFLANSWTIGLLVCMAGVLSSAFSPCSSAAIANCCEKRLRTRAFTLQRLAMNAGSAIGPAIGGLLATINFLWIFYIDAITCIGAAILVVIYALKSRGVGQLTEEPVSNSTTSLLVCLKDLRFLGVITLFILALVCYLQTKGAYPLYLKSVYKLLESEIGLLFTLNGLLIVSFEMIVAKKLEHFPRLRIAAIGYLIVGLALAILPLGGSFGVAAISMIFLSVGEMVGVPPTMAWIADRGNARSRAMYLGLYSSSIGVALGLAPLIGMRIYEINPNMLWNLMFVIGVSVCLGYLWLARKENPSPALP